jgi:hypothetical protein
MVVASNLHHAQKSVVEGLRLRPDLGEDRTQRLWYLEPAEANYSTAEQGFSRLGGLTQKLVRPLRINVTAPNGLNLALPSADIANLL